MARAPSLRTWHDAVVDTRPAIPQSLRREVLVEAGHRCAIPTCRQVPIKIAHIVPWSKLRSHQFDNLIALCPTCHTRFDRGDIDRRAMTRYKANLTIVSSRYGDLERRALDLFAQDPPELAPWRRRTLWLPTDHTFAFVYLLQDGLIEARWPHPHLMVDRAIDLCVSVCQAASTAPAALRGRWRQQLRQALHHPRSIRFDLPGEHGERAKRPYGYDLTPKGADFVTRWREARELT